MTRERKTQILTAAVLAALGLVLARRGEWRAQKPPATPQDAVYAMLDAARDGDVGAYLDAHTGQMAASLRQSLTETTPAAFAGYLKRSNSAVKGIAVSEPQPLSDREVRLRVEFVYQDRNEAQWMYLVKQDARHWKIARVDAAERVKTVIPYGTPVE